MENEVKTVSFIIKFSKEEEFKSFEKQLKSLCVSLVPTMKQQYEYIKTLGRGG